MNVETKISPNELVYDKVVGQGICGIVWKANWKDQTVAVKKFNEDSIAFSLEEFNSEVALMSVLRHENIVHCIGGCAEPENLYIVSELFEKGCVSDLINDQSFHLSSSMITFLALGAAKGMKYLHQLGIIHRDLKNGNLLVSNQFIAKVADFGLSRMMDNKMTRGVGTPIYTAPEALAGNQYTQKADVYSFAFVLWELVTRKVPFEDIPVFDAVIRASDEGLRPDIPPNCIFEDLIVSCWDKNPDSRPTFDQIVKALTQIQLLVGLPSEITNDNLSSSNSSTSSNHSRNPSIHEDEEDLEDQQYNYKEAKQIVYATLRSTNSKTEIKRKGSRIRNTQQTPSSSNSTTTTNQDNNVTTASISAPTSKHKRKASNDSPVKRREKKTKHAANNNSKSTKKTRRSLRDIGLFESSPPGELLTSSETIQIAASNTKTSSNSNLTNIPTTTTPSPLHKTPSSTPPLKKVSENFNLNPILGSNTNSSSNLPSTTSNSSNTNVSPPSSSSPISNSPNTNRKIPMKSCANCSSPISGRSIKVDTDCMYHVDCFVCAICKKSLLQLPWCNFEGKPYCRSDYQSLFAPKCGKCGNTLTDKYINALEKNWHKECFVCFKCDAPLAGKFEEVDGNPFCFDCATQHFGY